MTDSIDSYINKAVVYQLSHYELSVSTWEEDIDDCLHVLYNCDEDSFKNYGQPTLTEFMAIQAEAFEHLEEIDSLSLITDENRSWEWWLNIYALSRAWMNSSEMPLINEVFGKVHYHSIVNLQASVRMRQARIATIRKLHLTGTL